jgi:G3E family GTPase
MDVYAALESNTYCDRNVYRGDLINTLDTLLSKKSLDYVLVELNGLADPSAMIRTFWVDDGLGSLVSLHQTIALVDVKSFPKRMKNQGKAMEELKESVLLKDQEPCEFSESELLTRQLIYADKILLNKIDLLAEETRAHYISDLKDLIREVNPSAELIETTYSQASLDQLITKSDQAPLKPDKHCEC